VSKKITNKYYQNYHIVPNQIDLYFKGEANQDIKPEILTTKDLLKRETVDLSKELGTVKEIMDRMHKQLDKNYVETKTSNEELLNHILPGEDLDIPEMLGELEEDDNHEDQMDKS